ncbi:MAG: O-antigen ligase family protein [Candidatus Riflebacteria bacterium]|nr:O-antigen ligase family protein [Candidatus Riflebacteria bacterium]
MGTAWLISIFYFLVVLPIMYLSDELFSVFSVEIISVIFLSGILISFFRRASPETTDSTEKHEGASSTADRLTFRLLLVFLCIWIGTCFISCYFSIDPSSSFYSFLKLLTLILIFFESMLFFKDSTNSFLVVVCTACVIHSLFGISDYFQEIPIPATWIDPNLRDVIKTRSTGVFSDPNIFGAFLSMFFPFLLMGTVVSTEKKSVKTLFAGTLFISAYALFTTFSRGAYIASFCGLMVFLAVKKPSLEISFNKKILIALFLLLTVVFFAGPFKYRMFSIFRPSDMTFSQRTLINKAIIKALPDVPLTGYGLHTFSLIYPKFRVVGGDYPLYAHNEFMQMYIECGPVAFAAFGLICLTILLRIFQMIFSKKREEFFEACSAGVFSAVILNNISGFSSRIFPTAVVIAIVSAGLFRKDISLFISETKNQLKKTANMYLIFSGIIVFSVFCGKFYYTNILLNSAQRLLGEGKTIEAIKALETAEFLSPANSQIYFQRHFCHISAKEPEKAETSIDKAISLNPNEALFWLAKARFYLSSGNNKWESIFHKVIELDPAAEAFRLEYALALSSRGKTLEAIAQLDEALKSSPGFHDVYLKYKEVESAREELLLKISTGANFATSPVKLYSENDF